MTYMLGGSGLFKVLVLIKPLDKKYEKGSKVLHAVKAGEKVPSADSRVGHQKRE